MSQSSATRPQTFLANGAIANRFRFVILTAEYTVGPAGLSARAFGINQDTATGAGMGIAVATPGMTNSSKLEAGAAFAAGAMLKPDASARGITASSADPYSARALEAATAAGDLVEVVFDQGIAP